MQNTNDLKGALENLEHEAQHEAQEVNAKSKQLQEIETKKAQLEQDIRQLETQIKQKEMELEKDKKLEPTLKREIDLLRHKQNENQASLTRIHRDYEQSVRESSINNAHHH